MTDTCNYSKVLKSTIISNLYGGSLIKGLSYVFGLRLLKKKMNLESLFFKRLNEELRSYMIINFQNCKQDFSYQPQGLFNIIFYVVMLNSQQCVTYIPTNRFSKSYWDVLIGTLLLSKQPGYPS